MSEKLLNKNNILEIKNLSKSYKEIKAVNNISFSVKKGSFFAFLGVNGAGKSTTINMIASVLKKDSGSILIDGYDIDKDSEKVQKSIGIVFQNSVLDKLLSVKANLIFRANLYGLTKIELNENFNKVVQLLRLEDILKRPYGKLSGGQKRRVDIAKALIYSPKLLILDEPTTGLDPATRKMVWECIHKLREEENLTVFLTTHYMEEADEADEIVIIDKGEIKAQDPPITLKEKYASDILKLFSEKREDIDGYLSSNNFVFSYNGFYKISLDSSNEARIILNNLVGKYDDFEFTKGNLDDVFLAVTGKKLGEVDYEK